MERWRDGDEDGEMEMESVEIGMTCLIRDDEFKVQSTMKYQKKSNSPHTHKEIIFVIN